MNRSNLVLIFLLLLAIAVGWVLTGEGTPENETPANGDNGDIQVSKPIYYYFYSDSCPACKTMERTTHSNSTVIEVLEANFTFIKVNTGQNRELAQKYSIVYVPTNVFAYPGGQEIGRYIGAVEPEGFLGMLDQILEFYAQNS